MKAAECVKAISRHLGWVGRYGGWIYDSSNQIVCQGWHHAELIMRRRGWIVDRGEPFGCHIDWRRVPHIERRTYDQTQQS